MFIHITLSLLNFFSLSDSQLVISSINKQITLHYYLHYAVDGFHTHTKQARKLAENSVDRRERIRICLHVVPCKLFYDIYHHRNLNNYYNSSNNKLLIIINRLLVLLFGLE